MTHPSDEPRARAVPAGRLTRMGRMSGLAAGVASRMAVDGLRQWSQGDRPAARDLLLTPANVSRIASELARMRGAAMKVGQLVSMDTGDVLPPELAEIMARLRADADFMPPRQLRDVLDAEWGDGWRANFARFDVRPMAAASIGQVHRAMLPDGTELAIKVQYPGIARSIDSDVSNIGRLIRMSGLIPRVFDIDLYLDEARRQLREEADYTAEAAHLTRFADLLDNDSRFVVPTLHAPLTTGKVLAMRYVASDPIEHLQAASQETRDAAMHDLCDLLLKELFDFGWMQTDPNFANYRVDRQRGQIVLLDFGATRAVPKELAGAVADLMRAGLSGTRADVDRCAADVGLLPTSVPAHFRSRVLDMMMYVFDEIRANPLLDLRHSNLARDLQRQGEALARDGFVPPPVPMDLLFIQRKVAGMFLLAARLRARIPVLDLLANYLDRT
ncbi:MAG: ABC1 kinase family protein [Tateyamaria sp.]